jgi:hypothetical protein
MLLRIRCAYCRILSIASFAIRRVFGYVALNPEMRIPSRMKSPTLAALMDEETVKE